MGYTLVRQVLLFHLDWANVAQIRAGIFSFLLTGLETAVAIVVACIPLMRPLFSRWSRSGSDSDGKGRRWEAEAEERAFLSYHFLQRGLTDMTIVRMPYRKTSKPSKR